MIDVRSILAAVFLILFASPIVQGDQATTPGSSTATQTNLKLNLQLPPVRGFNPGIVQPPNCIQNEVLGIATRLGEGLQADKKNWDLFNHATKNPLSVSCGEMEAGLDPDKMDKNDCSIVSNGVLFDLEKFQAHEKRIKDAKTAIECNLKKREQGDKALACLKESANALERQISQMQSYSRTFLEQSQKDLQAFDESIQDVTKLRQETLDVLRGNEEAGRMGLIQVREEAEKFISQNGDLANRIIDIEENYKQLDEYSARIQTIKKIRVASRMKACMLDPDESISDYYCFVETGLKGQPRKKVRVGVVEGIGCKLEYDYIVQQQRKPRDSDLLAAAQLKQLAENDITKLLNQIPNEIDYPSSVDQLPIISDKELRFLDPDDIKLTAIRKAYGNVAANELKKQMDRCYNRALGDVKRAEAKTVKSKSATGDTDEVKSSGTAISQLEADLSRRKGEVLKTVNSLTTKAEDLYQQAWKAMTLNAAKTLPRFQNCGSPSLKTSVRMNCLKATRMVLDDLLRGEVSSGIAGGAPVDLLGPIDLPEANILVKGTKTPLLVKCLGLNRCITQLQANERDLVSIAQDLSIKKTNRANEVSAIFSSLTKNSDPQASSMSLPPEQRQPVAQLKSSLNYMSKYIRDQIDDINKNMAGIFPRIDADPVESSDYTVGPNGLPDLAGVDFRGLIGGSIDPPLLDVEAALKDMDKKRNKMTLSKKDDEASGAVSLEKKLQQANQLEAVLSNLRAKCGKKEIQAQIKGINYLFKELSADSCAYQKEVCDAATSQIGDLFNTLNIARLASIYDVDGALNFGVAGVCKHDKVVNLEREIEAEMKKLNDAKEPIQQTLIASRIADKQAEYDRLYKLSLGESSSSCMAIVTGIKDQGEALKANPEVQRALSGK